MGFLFAQVFHPAMKSVSAVRRELGIRTIFNILGPLTNPASPTHMLVGVGSRELGDLYAQVLLAMVSEPHSKRSLGCRPLNSPFPTGKASDGGALRRGP